MKLSIPRADLSTDKVNYVFVNREMFESSFKPYFSNICINCSRLSMAGIEKYIGIAKNLSLFKYYYLKQLNFTEFENLTFKITLKGVKEFNQKFIEFLKDKIKKITSYTDKEFLIEVQYDTTVARGKVIDSTPSHIRVISDIHHDYNRSEKYLFDFGNDFIINCGDTGGDANTCINWNKNYVKQGVVVAGNHLGYSPSHPELDGVTIHEKNTKNTQLLEISTTFSGNNGIRLLSNSLTEHQGIVIIGSTLFTDFALYGKDKIEQCMAYAKKYMNDFRYIYVVGHREYSLNPDGTWKIKMKKRSESTVRPFTPQDHAYFFNFSIGYIKEKVQEYKHKPIIIVTHHAPSPYSISPEYKGDILSAAFASNLNEFIIDNPQIRVWAHGHVHSPFDYILGQTRVVCCPFGYRNENNFALPENYGTRISIEDIKSKEPWTEILKNRIIHNTIKVYTR